MTTDTVFPSLDKTQPLDVNLQHLRDQPRTALEAFGDEWAANCAGSALTEIARLQAQVTESQRQSDALLARGLDYCDKIEALQAQVDALTDSLKRIRLHCANASSYRLGQAVDSIAEHALSAVGR